MATNLESLELEEVSLCDFPSNAETDPRTGKKVPRSVVALAKRDSQYLSRDAMLAFMDAENNRRIEKGLNPMGKKSMFEQVLKSAVQTKRRDQIATAVSLEATRIAKRDGISVEKAECEVWKANPKAAEAYESARLPDLKPEQKTLKLTGAEVELHRRARKLMRKSVGQSYAQCASKALQDDPGLYTRYQKELAAGTTYDVPETEFQQGSDVVKAGSDDDECPDCGEEIEDGDLYCSGCGKKL
jgi:hypothetical protein